MGEREYTEKEKEGLRHGCVPVEEGKLTRYRVRTVWGDDDISVRANSFETEPSGVLTLSRSGKSFIKFAAGYWTGISVTFDMGSVRKVDRVISRTGKGA